MKYLIATITVVIMAFASVRADTTWVAAGDIDGRWSVGGSPFMIHEGTVTIAAADTLLIDPGVEVKFTGPYKIVVNGLLRAEGRADSLITFTSDVTVDSSRWRGIRFLTAHDSCLMSYCVIERARASGPGDDRYGGGVECRASRPLFSHCTIRNCYALIDGGAVYCRDGAAPTFQDCEMYGNRADYEGGGAVFSRTAAPTLIRCSIHHNTTPRSGGGAMFANGGSATLIQCTLSNNTAVTGGGLYVSGQTTLITCTETVVSANQATASGGGVYSVRANPLFSRCDLDSNTAPLGGAVFDTSAGTRLVNCRLRKNTATQDGGAVYSYTGSTTLLDYCTLFENSAERGADVYIRTSTPTLRSSIFGQSVSGQGIYFQSSPDARIGWSDFYGHAGGAFGGGLPDTLGVVDTVNYNFNPCDRFFNMFVDPQWVDRYGGDFHLADGSMCISAGASGDVTEDRDGNPRPNPANSREDMGAYESPISSGYTHLCGALSGQIGPGDAFVDCDISVETDDTLEVAPGTRLLFRGPYSFTIRGLILALGAPADSIVFTVSDTAATYWRGLRFVQSHDSCRLAHCVIENARGEGYVAATGSGGVYCDSASPRLRRCTIHHNTASFHGGGIACYNGSHPELSYCTIRANEADGFLFLFGGGVATDHSSPRFIECEIDSNIADFGGGGIYSDSSEAQFIRCIVHDNAAPRGAGVYCSGPGPTFSSCEITRNAATLTGGGAHLASTSRLDSCVIHGNTAPDGGGVSCDAGQATLNHCITYGNVATRGGAIFCRTSTPIIQRCTLARDTASSGGEICLLDAQPNINSSIIAFSAGAGIFFQGNSSASSVHHCDFFLNTAGAFSYFGEDPSQGPPGLGWLTTVNINGDSCDDYSNIFMSPRFASPTPGEVDLIESSPCINSGDPVLPPDPDGTRADMGARHYPSPYHLPSPFSLISPDDWDTLSLGPQQFCWQSSSDPDPGDHLSYVLWLATTDVWIEAATTDDTCTTVDLSQIFPGYSGEGAWFVVAHCQLPDSSTRCDTSRFFYILPLSGGEMEPALPHELALHSNFPNPFNSSTRISFALPRAGDVSLTVYDLAGRQVSTLVSELLAAGEHSIWFDASGMPSGIYFARLDALGLTRVQKMILLR